MNIGKPELKFGFSISDFVTDAEAEKLLDLLRTQNVGEEKLFQTPQKDVTANVSMVKNLSVIPLDLIKKIQKLIFFYYDSRKAKLVRAYFNRSEINKKRCVHQDLRGLTDSVTCVLVLSGDKGDDDIPLSFYQSADSSSADEEIYLQTKSIILFGSNTFHSASYRKNGINLVLNFEFVKD